MPNLTARHVVIRFERLPSLQKKRGARRRPAVQIEIRSYDLEVVDDAEAQATLVLSSRNVRGITMATTAGHANRATNVIA